ncbi:arginine deiminase [Acrasis kona]|uniref:Arginine deiminase n=1 Tax=Acrasis kona TaxID=1008807 RepID=A0AAW2Z3H0_9EUKA
MLLVIFIDPVFDFVDERGIFFQKFKEDSQPLIDVLPVLDDVLQCCKDLPHVKTVLCTSIYKVKQFKTDGLENLCTEERGQQSLLDPSKFNLHAIKKTNNMYDLFDANKTTELDDLVDMCDKVLVTGVTSTSCVRATIQELLKQKKSVIVALDAIAHRKSSNNTASSLVNQWNNQGVIIKDAWKSVLHEFGYEG